MPEVVLSPPTAADASELGRICHEAFADISRKHGFEPDIDNPAIWQAILASLISNETVHSTAATLDGALAGSNFLAHRDEVGGIGPITVDPNRQGHGIGRKLMIDALDFAKDDGIEMVRLVQEAFNMTSMSLYTSLGFDTKVPLGLFAIQPAEADNPEIRAMTDEDKPAADALCREIYKISRRRELDGPGFTGVPPLVIERNGRIRGYLVVSIAGHGVAETNDDMIALIGESARRAPMPLTQFIPLTNGELMRKALASGHKLKKMMNLMALGPYEEPDGVWVPSILF